MRIIRKLRTEYALRGSRGVARLLATRLIRVRSDLLFEKALDNASPDDRPPETLRIVVVNRSTARTPQAEAVARQILRGDNEEYGHGLPDRDWMFAGLDSNGCVITYAFVLFRTRYKQVLGLPDAVPLICNCFTVEEHRGKRLYPRMLRQVCYELALAGHPRAAITCAPDNTASINGIERAGFKGVAHLRSINVLSQLIFGRRATPYATWRAAHPATAARKAEDVARP